MKLYLAGPLFTTGERSFNAELTVLLRAAGHEVFLPQDQEPDQDARGIFTTDLAGLEWAEAVVAVMDGPDPDSGTCWECGYAYGKKPIVLLRTDIRSFAHGRLEAYNPMLTESADVHVELPLATPTEAAAAVLPILGRFASGR